MNLSSGDRAVLVALAAATTVTDKEIFGVTLFSDTTRQQLEVDFPSFSVDLNDTEREILGEVIRNGDMTNSDIENVTGIAKSTVSERLDGLVDKGFIRREKDGKMNKIEPRLAGILAANSK